MGYCPKCGALTAEGAAFCSQCGTPVQGGAAPNPFQVGSETQTVGYDIADITDVAGEAPEVPNPFRAFAICMKKYCDAKGRAGRAEYFGYVLVYALIIYAAGFLWGWCCDAMNLDAIMTMRLGGLVGLAIGLGCMLPAWSLLIRRFHDLGVSGWFSVIQIISILSSIYGVLALYGIGFVFFVRYAQIFRFVEIVMAIFSLVLICVPGQRRPNKYGLPPQRRAK